MINFYIFVLSLICVGLFQLDPAHSYKSFKIPEYKTKCKTNKNEDAILVAIVDMGIDFWKHPHIKDKMWSGPRFMRGWDFGKEEETSGADYSFLDNGEYHGTYIAHQIVKRPSEDCSRKYNIKIMDVIYSDYYGEKFGLNKLLFAQNNLEVYRRQKAYNKLNDQIAEAFQFAIDSGAKIINFSSNDPAMKSEKLYEVIKKAQEKNVIFVVSSGNEGLSLDKYPAYPCSFDLDNIICVGAKDRKGKIASFSNTGSDVDVFALGVYEKGKIKGTSFASPVISQHIAWLMNNNPRYDYKKIRDLVLKKFKLNK